jgi:hypothetical protein
MSLDLVTDRGVFSPGRVDPGTRMLLIEIPRPPVAGDLLVRARAEPPTRLPGSWPAG